MGLRPELFRQRRRRLRRRRQLGRREPCRATAYCIQTRLDVQPTSDCRRLRSGLLGATATAASDRRRATPRCATGEFCNFDHGSSGFCEPCSSFSEPTACYNDGLPEDGATTTGTTRADDILVLVLLPRLTNGVVLVLVLATRTRRDRRRLVASARRPTALARRLAELDRRRLVPRTKGGIGDLTSYDNDGGDCDGDDNWDDESPVCVLDCTPQAWQVDRRTRTRTSGPTPTCDVGYVADCSGDGDCCLQRWIGDGWCDGEDQNGIAT